MSDEPTAGNDARTAKDALTTEKRSGSADLWAPTESEVADDEIVTTDGGHRPGHTPSTTSPPDPGAGSESSSTSGGVTRLPEVPGFERDILLTLARSQPTNGQGLLADLSTLRDEEVGDARLYPHLNGLADAGLVEKRENYHDDRSHEYRLADAGGHALREHAQRLEGAVEALSESN